MSKRLQWLPLLVALATPLATLFLFPHVYGALALVAVCGLVFAFYAVLLAVRWRQKRWPEVAGATLAGLASAAMLPVTALMLMAALFEGSDDFADDLVIPPGVDAHAPIPRKLMTGPDTPRDPYRAVLPDVAPAAAAAPFTPELGALVALRAEGPELLERYLATHPGWRVFRGWNGRFAERAWQSPRGWGFRLLLALSGRPSRDPPQDGVTRTRSGEAVEIRTQRLDYEPVALDSECLIEAGDLLVEVREWSSDPGRRATRAATAHLESEMAALRAAGDWRAIGADAWRRGEASFDLHEGMQPGIYRSELWLNAGEPGRVYLRAFEITREHPLSSDSVVRRTNEWAGWSEDPEELFLATSRFTIYEGDWGQPYAARFEVWFDPDSGAPERKLMQRTYRIEGWQR